MGNNPRTISDLGRGIGGAIKRVGKWKLKFVIPGTLVVIIFAIIGINWPSISKAYHDQQALRQAKQLQDQIITARETCTSVNYVNQVTFDNLTSCIGSSYPSFRYGSSLTFEEIFYKPYREYFSMGLPPGSLPTNVSDVKWDSLYNGCLGEPMVYFGDRIPKSTETFESIAALSKRLTVFRQSLSTQEIAQYERSSSLTKEDYTAQANAYAKLSDFGRKKVLSYLQCMWDSVPGLTRPR
jgi:hypothetical protein